MALNKVSGAINTNKKVRYLRSKILFLGAGGVGKTSTIDSLIGIPFEKRHISTRVASTEKEI